MSIKKIKGLRQEVTSYMAGIQSMNVDHMRSREKSSAITAIQQCGHWLGQAINYSNNAPDTYGVVDDPNKIPEKRDVGTPWELSGNELEDLNALRALIGDLAEEIWVLPYEVDGLMYAGASKKEMSIKNAWAKCKEARMWLGEDLGRLRDKK